MSKRRSDTQLTKDDYEAQMNGGFNFSANRVSEGGPDDLADPSKMADSKVMMGRKIAPLKKGRGRGGPTTGARSGGSSIPNFFAAAPGAVFGANGTTGQQPTDGGMGGGFGGFGTPNAAPMAPSFGGNATGGGFGFGGGSNAPEQPKPNPFGSLASSTPSTNGGGMFGSTAQPQLGGSLFGSPAPQNSSSGGMFGNSNNTNGSVSPAPTTSGFMFGSNSNTTGTQPSSTGFNKAPSSFTFGGGSTASPMFGSGDNNKSAGSSSFTFGANTSGASVATPPATSSFTFGASTATAPAQSTGGYFGTPSPAPEKTPEPQAAPAVAASAPSFTFGAATPTQQPQGSSLFGKPAEPQGSSLGSSLFGRPTPSPEPTSSNFFALPKPTPSPEPSLFGPSTPVPAPASTSLFGAPPKAQEQSKSLFGFGEQKQTSPKEAPKSFFSGFGTPTTEKKDEQNKPLFGFSPAPEKKQDEPSKPLFGGFSPAPEKKQDEPSKPLFGGFSPAPEKTQLEPAKETPKAQSPFSFGAPEKKDDEAMDENPAPKPSIFDGQPINSSTFSGFSAPKFATAPTNQFMSPPPSMVSPATTTTNHTTFTTNARTPSPPLPSDATQWSVAQLTEYYNLFALRSLNHSFLEGLKKADQMGDWSAACEVYIKESARIKGCQEHGERYKGADSKLAGVPSKRSNATGDNDNEGGGKRSKGNAEDSRTPSSDSSKALASIIGGNKADSDVQLATKPVFGFAPPTNSSSSTSGPKLASAPLFGFHPPGAAPAEVKQEEKKASGSVFDNPNSPANNGGFVNPFTSSTPDASDKDMDDEDDDEAPAQKSTGGSLFDRISEPKKDTASGSIFGNSVKSPSGLFSSKPDQTWSSDKGLKFGESTNGNVSSIFGQKPSDSKPSGSFFGAGSSASSAASTPGASGTSSLFGTPGPKPEVGFSFGSNGTTKPSAPISMPSSSAVSTPDDSGASEPNDNAHLAKNEVDLSAQGPGEEDEDSMFQVRAIIYEFPPGGGAAKKAGVGTLRVLKNRLTGKARVITRTEGGKVVLNVALVKEVNYGIGDKGGKNVSIVEFLPGGGKPNRYSVRVKDEPDAKRLGEVLDQAKM